MVVARAEERIKRPKLMMTTTRFRVRLTSGSYQQVTIHTRRILFLAVFTGVR
jgi:hypothetical protein